MSKSLAEIVPTGRALARVLGVSEALVSRLYRTGVFRRGDALPALVQAFVERERSLVEAASAAASSDFEAERTGLYKARREAAELDLRQRRGEVVPAAELRRVLVASFAACRERIWSWQVTLAPRLAGRPVVEVALELERAAREALEALAEDVTGDTRKLYRWLQRNAPPLDTLK